MLTSALSSLVRRLGLNSSLPQTSARKSPSNRFRPRLDQFEAREVPATFTWLGTVGTNALDAGNWAAAFESTPWDEEPYHPLPIAGDSVIFGGGLGAGAAPNCDGFIVSGGGTLKSVKIDYTNTGQTHSIP
ncbi:hypothetical protein GobsT_22870 [Gemmata obscuriglobus]|uniref:Uncharacterized protein n=1 Tax=Gemmata obscuriglobus TaxID=114 RepID=A0A2Z3H053_9BACT|nr:hypothetical protein [Gemmata obscuriglobus]AWM39393.1 hypothetical protein C1280_22005 [Gemmata obscuriglobus]QEG27531.1 hypothetical protein GobsT_22870 [Gemmata obscuriglobus]VTS04581.1 unnamed protein product [Gemmata obscuriglobus UQM 2246]